MPTNSPLRLTTGLPELPPMMSAVETKFIGVAKSSWSLFAAQLAGKRNGCWLLCSADALESAVDRRPGRNLSARLAVAFHLAECQAKRECRVGIGVRAVQREPHGRDFGIRLPHRLVDLRFVALAHRPGRRIDERGQADHRVGRCGDRLFAAGREPLALVDGGQLRSMNQFGGPIARRFAGQNLSRPIRFRRPIFSTSIESESASLSVSKSS